MLDADGRFGAAWNAVTLILRGHVEDALEQLEGFSESEDLDGWGRDVVRGCTLLRRAQRHIRAAEALEDRGGARDAGYEWVSALGVCQSAAGAVTHPADPDPEGPRTPDPWPELVQLFTDYVEERRRAASVRRPAV